jgi:hypothetical protein
MNESPDLVSCPKCDRPILRHALKTHLVSCEKEKPVKATTATTATTKKPTASGNDKPNENGKRMGTPNGEIAVAMPPNKKKRKLDDSTFPRSSVRVLIIAESINGENTPPKKKPAKRDKEESEPATKKEKKKKTKPTVAKPKC